MKRSTRICGLAIIMALLTASQAWAQAEEPDPEQQEEEVDDAEPAPTDEDEVDDEEVDDAEPAPADEEDVDDTEPAPADEEDVDDTEPAPADEEDVDDAEPAPADDEVEDAPSVEPEIEEPPAPPEADEDFDEPWPDDDDDEWDDDEWDDDFEDFGDDIDFVPLEELDDAMLDRITPVATFPFVEHSGRLRIRPRLRHGFDLGTEGTSAILPPIDTQVPQDQPADPDARRLRTAELRLDLAPTFHLSESFRVHTDLQLLPGVALGADPRHDFFVPGAPSADRRIMDSSVGDPLPVYVREAYGEMDTFLGTFQAGRMLNHWGLGIFANDGSGPDADFGDQVDRFSMRTRLFDTYFMAAYDLTDSGLASHVPGFDQGHSLAVGRLDTANQWTFSAFRSPLSREERERQAHQLADGSPVYNGGLYFSMRSQEGAFPFDGDDFDADDTQDPIYRGLQLYTASPWIQFLFSPEPDHRIRLELEAFGILGSVDNPTSDRVGFEDEEAPGETPDINCFNDDARDDFPAACRTGADGERRDRSVRQLGVAVESEFNFGGRSTFGLNSGFATGGDEPNWGYTAAPGDQLDFTRFSPDYHVDLILFREVIGTVTNAYYVNPYIMATFLDSGLQHMEIQLDAIGSRAFDAAGTPGQSPWLGAEFDLSLRYIDGDTFVAALEGGILFPFSGLGATEGTQRLNYYGDPGPFTDDQSPNMAWTVQGRLSWNF